MKVLVTGASGLLGRAICAKYSKCEWDVLKLAYSRAKDDLVKVDLHDFPAVRKIVYDFKPDIIIHSAAERSPDNCEKSYNACYSLNVECSENLATVAMEVQAAFLFLSTDYVFDGENPPYEESATPSPINKYGVSKLAGENAVMKANPDSCVLRVSLMYGGEEYLGESSVSSLLKALLDAHKPAFASNKEIRYPIVTSDVAEICFELMSKKLKDWRHINGVYHYAGEESLTKYEMMIALALVLNLPHDFVVPVDDEPPDAICARPKNPQLSCLRLKNLGIDHRSDFVPAIKYYKKFLEA